MHTFYLRVGGGNERTEIVLGLGGALSFRRKGMIPKGSVYDSTCDTYIPGDYKKEKVNALDEALKHEAPTNKPLGFVFDKAVCTACYIINAGRSQLICPSNYVINVWVCYCFCLRPSHSANEYRPAKSASTAKTLQL